MPDAHCPVRPPRLLDFSIGGWPDGEDRLRFRKGELWTQGRPAEDRMEVPWIRRMPPSQEAWEGLWKLLQRVGAPAWARNYDDLSVDDGTQWSLWILWERTRIRCDGSNAFPHGFNALEGALRRFFHLPAQEDPSPPGEPPERP